DLAAGLRLEGAAAETEEPRPLDHMPDRESAEPTEVFRRFLREDRDVLDLRVQLVLAAYHAVAEPVGPDGELDGHEWMVLPVEEFPHDPMRPDRVGRRSRGDLERVRLQDVVDHIVADESGEEIVDHGPLKVPPDDPSGLVESSSFRESRD